MRPSSLLQRFATNEEAANLVAYVASPLSSATNGAALRVEHYEIAGYTAAIAIAKTLGEREIVSLLTETLNEESEAGKKILAASKPLLQEANAEGDEEEVEEEEA